ncbi:MAG: hypothetical protein K0S35_631 [Geminicoccaceae bacterium]|nr:hypothetical protein [Geminicoccaceae bacterium]
MPALGCEAHRSAPAFLASHAPGPLTVNARQATKSCFTKPWTARPWEGDDAYRRSARQAVLAPVHNQLRHSELPQQRHTSFSGSGSKKLRMVSRGSSSRPRIICCRSISGREPPPRCDIRDGGVLSSSQDRCGYAPAAPYRIGEPRSPQPPFLVCSWVAATDTAMTAWTISR